MSVNPDLLNTLLLDEYSAALTSKIQEIVYLR